MKKISIAVILAAALLSACGGGGGKRGVSAQSSSVAPSDDEPANVRFASADTPRVQTSTNKAAVAATTALPTTGTLLNLLFVGAATITVGSRLGRKRISSN